MQISEALFQRLQELAAVRVDEAAAGEFAEQLSRIVESLQVLSELDTKRVSSSEAEGVPMQALREDIAEPSLPLERILLNAPERFESFFRVPKIIEEETEA